VAIANALQLEEARRQTRPFPALRTTPCQVWSRWLIRCRII